MTKTKQKKQYAGYFRVSTAEQGKSGAGLVAQRRAVLDYINGNGKTQLVREFKEIESGTKDRPELQKAIEYCRETGACLVAAKLDRLARSVWLFEKIRRAGISFEIVGLPKNPLVLQVLVSVAEWEARAISERTKAALAVKKSQGVKLGYNRPEVRAGVKRYWREKKREKARNPAPAENQPSKRELADQAIVIHLRIMRKQGLTYQAIADALNQEGLKSRGGKKWSKQQIHTVAKRNGVA